MCKPKGGLRCVWWLVIRTRVGICCIGPRWLRILGALTRMVLMSVVMVMIAGVRMLVTVIIVIVVPVVIVVRHVVR